MRRLAAVSAAALALGGGGSSWAEAAFPAAAPLSDAELAEVRAGFVDVDGVQFAFSVVTQTVVNGELVLATHLNVISPTGVSRSASAAASLTGVSDTASALVPTGPGFTAVFQAIGGSQIVNVVSTSASNQVIRQDTSVALSLQGFEQNQQSFDLQRTVANLNRLMGSALLPGH